MPQRGNRIRVGTQFQATIPPMAGSGGGAAAVAASASPSGGADPMVGGKRKGSITEGQVNLQVVTQVHLEKQPLITTHRPFTH